MGSSAGGAPLCLVKQVPNEANLVICPEGLDILREIKEPVAVICLAGQYRTGKSFFLNRLTNQQKGFSVGKTTESCTRGIWLWNSPDTVNTKGTKVLLMDTEGMSALDNDETYDAKIFSLGLLLSSLFIFNSMGVIDEAAIDRLFLVSELSKYVCVHGKESDDNGDPETDDPEVVEKELSQYFPPFMWLLRDFMLELEVDGRLLNANEYLESALEIRQGGGNARRLEERNRIRKSLRSVFATRECITLVRPATDEDKLRNAGDLADADLRPEFVNEMNRIRKKIMGTVQPKKLFGQVFDGPKLAHLVEVYTNTMNSGAIPDIKGAWEYVSEATCRAAEQKACEFYDAGMNSKIASVDVPVSQQTFDSVHKKLQEEVLRIFKKEAVDGSGRAAAAGRLKTYVQSQRVLQLNNLVERSRSLCKDLCHELIQECFLKDIERNAWTNVDEFESGVESFLEKYDAQGHGPAKKSILLEFFVGKVMTSVVKKFFKMLEGQHQSVMKEMEEAARNTTLQFESQVRELEGSSREQQMEIQNLQESKAGLQERLGDIQERLEASVATADALREKNEELETKLSSTKELLEEARDTGNQLDKELGQTNIRLEHATESIASAREELLDVKEKHAKECETLESSREKIEQDAAKNSERQQELLEESRQQIENLRGEVSAGRDIVNDITSELNECKNQVKVTAAEKLRLEGELSQSKDMIDSLTTKMNSIVSNREFEEEGFAAEKNMMQSRLSRVQCELEAAMDKMEVQKCLDHCVSKVANLAEVDKSRSLIEERTLMQEKLGDLYMKISTLPDFYQRQVFCSEEPAPTFFETMTK